MRGRADARRGGRRQGEFVVVARIFFSTPGGMEGRGQQRVRRCPWEFLSLPRGIVDGAV